MARFSRLLRTLICLVVISGLAWASTSCREKEFPEVALSVSGAGYTNYRVAEVPWSLHVVEVGRVYSRFAVHSVHAGGGALGFSCLSTQIATLAPSLGVPVAAVNGDFYQRDKAYAGHPRGLQIAEGELLSAPNGGVSFWMDALGQPHATNVVSLFQITWPDGASTPFELNGERRTNGVQLYTPAVGSSTHTEGGRELILERKENNPWLPLRIGRTYWARVGEIREKGDTPVAPGTVVLSLGPAVLGRLPLVKTGGNLQISTATLPPLQGVNTALSGGPVLVRDRTRQSVGFTETNSYEFSSMGERHPRAAIGWNRRSFVLVAVDGRQKDLSVGMTLGEFSVYLVRLGCEVAMNLDGGGSATLWYNGHVVNRPCDGSERGIANCLVVVRKESKVGTTNAVNLN